MADSHAPVRRRMRRAVVAACLAGGVIAAGLTATGAGAAPAIRDHPLPTPNAGLGDYYWDTGIVNWDGALWFAQRNTGTLGRIDTSGTITQHPLADGLDEEGAGAQSLSVGADGLWVLADRGDHAILRRADGQRAAVKVPSFTGASSILAEPSATGGVWLGDFMGEGVFRATSAELRRIAVEFERPGVMAKGSDGAVWLADDDGGALQRLTEAGDVRAFPLPGPCRPSLGCNLPRVTSMVSGPDGNTWYTRSGLRTITSGTYEGFSRSTAHVGRMATNGRAKEWALPNPKLSPDAMVVGPDKALWFATADGLGRVTTGGRLRLMDLPGGRTANSIAFGPDRALWFTDDKLNRISRVTMPAAVALAGPEIRSTALRLAGDRIRVKLACPAGAGVCRGRVTVKTGPNVVAAAPYVVRGGRVATVATRLKSGKAVALRGKRTKVEIGVAPKGGATGDSRSVLLRG